MLPVTALPVERGQDSADLGEHRGRTVRDLMATREVDSDTFAGLPNVLPGERAVYIKPEVILEAADKIRAMRRG